MGKSNYLHTGPAKDAEILRAGWLMVDNCKGGCFGGSGWKRMFIIVKGTFIQIYKKTPSPTKPPPPEDSILLVPTSGFELEMQGWGVPIGPGKRQIVCITPQKTRRFICDSQADAREWAQCFKWARDEVTRGKAQDKVFEALLVKGKGESLGLQLSRGFNASLPFDKSVIIIKGIEPHSVADKNRTLDKGDIVTHINGEPLIGMTHEFAQAQLDANPDHVLLYLLRKGKTRRASRATPLTAHKEDPTEVGLPVTFSSMFQRQSSSTSFTSISSGSDESPPKTPRSPVLVKEAAAPLKRIEEMTTTWSTSSSTNLFENLNLPSDGSTSALPPASPSASTSPATPGPADGFLAKTPKKNKSRSSLDASGATPTKLFEKPAPSTSTLPSLSTEEIAGGEPASAEDVDMRQARLNKLGGARRKSKSDIDAKLLEALDVIDSLGE